MTLLADRYELLEALGSGGEGAVWRAHDRVTGGHVAVKRLRRARGRSSRAARTRTHDALVQVLDEVAVDNASWLVMEWIDGENLAAQLARAGPLPAEHVVALLRPIADALEHLHSGRWPRPHGDVKPANIVVTRDGRPVLVDLGEPAAGRGTDGFRAPEVAVGGVPGPAADVFGLAATAIALLTGAPPTAGDPVQLARVSAALRLGLVVDPRRRPTPTNLMRAFEVVPTNVPASDDPCIGRDHDLRCVAGLLASHRLVTISGIGGIGKTRLATEVAHRIGVRFPAGVWFARAETDAPGGVAWAFAGALDLQTTSEPPLPRIATRFGKAPALLVLDTADEQPVSIAEFVAAACVTCPTLSILVAARRPLGVESEAVHPLVSLGRPFAEELAALWGVPLVAAASGIPLAIRLGGAKSARSVAHAIAEAVDGLAPRRRAALHRLSCFRFPWTAAGAWTVARVGARELSILDGHGLVERVGERYRLLDLVAAEVRRHAVETPETRRRMQTWTLAMCAGAIASDDLDEGLAVARRAAETGDHRFLEVAIDALIEHVRARGADEIGARWAQEIIGIVDPTSRAAQRARIAYARCCAPDRRSEIETDAVARGDEVTLWVSRCSAPASTSPGDLADWLETLRQGEEVLAANGESRLQSIVVANQSSLAVAAQEWAASRQLLLRALDLARTASSRRAEGFILVDLGIVAHALGDADGAALLIVDAIALLDESGDWVPAATARAALAFIDPDDVERSLELAETAAVELGRAGNLHSGCQAVAIIGYHRAASDPARGLLLMEAGMNLIGDLYRDVLKLRLAAAYEAAQGLLGGERSRRISAEARELDLRTAVEMAIAP